MRRCDFITLIGGAVAAWPITARAQVGKIARVGFINPGLVLPITAGGYPIFLAELRKLGSPRAETWSSMSVRSAIVSPKPMPAPTT